MADLDTSRPLGKREVRKQEKRAAFVSAARRSFLDVGYAATSMSGLLEALGGSKATLWSYFPSKEALFAAVVDDITSAFRTRLEDGLLASGSIETTLAGFCRDFIQRTTNPDAVGAWRLVVSESGRSPEVGRVFYEMAVSQVERALATYIERQVDAGLLRDEGATNMAQTLISLCASPQTKLLLGVDSGSEDDAARRFAAYFMRLFGL